MSENKRINKRFKTIISINGEKTLLDEKTKKLLTIEDIQDLLNDCEYLDRQRHYFANKEKETHFRLRNVLDIIWDVSIRDGFNSAEEVLEYIQQNKIKGEYKR